MNARSPVLNEYAVQQRSDTRVSNSGRVHGTANVHRVSKYCVQMKSLESLLQTNTYSVM